MKESCRNKTFLGSDFVHLEGVIWRNNSFSLTIVWSVSWNTDNFAFANNSLNFVSLVFLKLSMSSNFVISVSLAFFITMNKISSPFWFATTKFSTEPSVILSNSTLRAFVLGWSVKTKLTIIDFLSVFKFWIFSSVAAS
ncbi:hypothetical protein NWE60_03015 [Mycoplasmopsis felis]|nr:hypothetical protein [Mycoplasmopsis felis]WAM01544.1 hypothetical protein NWE60_03015 [Mycoplasmopsis felis]